MSDRQEMSTAQRLLAIVTMVCLLWTVYLAGKTRGRSELREEQLEWQRSRTRPAPMELLL